MIVAAFAAMQAIQTRLAFRDRRRGAKAYDITFDNALSDIKIAKESHGLTTITPVAHSHRTDWSHLNRFNQYSEILKSEQELLPS